MKKLYSIDGNSQKLDGGAMFGNAPKAMWQNWVQVDSTNRIDLACRALLVKDGEKIILLEAGIGAFFEPKYKDRFGVVEDEHVLLESLKAVGLDHEDIDIIVLSHLHFDHIGGLFSQWQANQAPQLLFPNAQVLVGKQAWERATSPHSRDRASFIPELISALQSSQRLNIVDAETHQILGDDYRFHLSSGHTPGMMLTEIAMPAGPVVFCADLVPGVPWVHLPITMGYDRFPELLIDEKQQLLNDILTRHGYLYFTHDSQTAMGKLTKNDKGKFIIEKPMAKLDAEVLTV